ncbi:MAG: PQQ-dependent sugar dehydrogenase, partial [Nitrososphaeraceae archaeon]
MSIFYEHVLSIYFVTSFSKISTLALHLDEHIPLVIISLATTVFISVLFLHVADGAPSVSDNNLKVETVTQGLSSPTSMAFIDSKNILVLEKSTGKVRLISNGVLKSSSILTVSVNSESERGLLGVATLKRTTVSGNSKIFVFIYYTSQEPRNKVVRYEWTGSSLTNRALILNLPALPGKNHDGGKLLVSSDNNLYVIIGDLNHNGKLQNNKDGMDPDDTGVIFRIDNPDTVSTVADISNPFTLTETQDLLSKYYAYGIRNSFGLAMDGLTGRLWQTENGPNSYDEINYIRHHVNGVNTGFNSGWNKVMGPISRTQVTPDQLVNFPGFKYHDPVFSWKNPIAVTGLAFFHSSKLGTKYQDNLFVGDYLNGNLYFFKVNSERSGLTFDSNQQSLKDLVADDENESNSVKFGSGFNGITDVKRSPDGLLYVVSIKDGKLYRI